MSSDFMAELCRQELIWDQRKGWNTTTPIFTDCFQKTVPIWVPALFLFICSPFEIYQTIKYPLASARDAQGRVRSIPFNVYNVSRYLATVILIVTNAVQFGYDLFEFPQFLHLIGMTETSNGKAVVGADVLAPLLYVATFSLFLLIIFLHRVYGHHTSGTAWIFIFLALVCYLPVVYMNAMFYGTDDDDNAVDTFHFALFCVHFSMLFIIFLLTCFADVPSNRAKQSQADATEHDEESALGENGVDNSYELKQTNGKVVPGEAKSLATGAADADTAEELPELRASFLSCLTMWWFNSMAIKGYRTSLTTKDLWQLKSEVTTNVVAPRFDRNWLGQIGVTPQMIEPKTSADDDSDEVKVKFVDRTKSRKPGITMTLINTFGLYFLSGAVLKFGHDILQFVSPQLLKAFIQFVSRSASEEPIWHGFLIAVAFFVVPTIQSFLLNNYFYIMYQIGMQVRTALISAIYRKALNLSNAARRDVTSGEIVNLMSVDAQKFVETLPFINLLWSSPLQIVFAIYFLWQELGVSVLAGLSVMIVMLPLNGVISAYQRRMHIGQMKLKDERVKVINEFLGGMRVIKLYAWEIPFIGKVTDIRERELQNLKLISYVNAVTSFLWTCAPFLVSFCSFAVFVLISDENVLDAKKAFVSLSLFNLLRFPLTMMPQMITMVVTLSVSIKRLNKFLVSPQLEQYVVKAELKDDSIVIENGHFCWLMPEVDTNPKADGGTSTPDNEDAEEGDVGDKLLAPESNGNDRPAEGGEKGADAATTKKENNLTLRDINLRIKKGSLVAIIGSVASGKSSLLHAILGEMERISGKIEIDRRHKVAYVPQQAWIQNATVKENILFGERYIRNRYKCVLSMCALETDIAILPGGDQTEIGEKGINLSGGQKQRVSLARACYSNSDMILLDDPLSAVDSHVAQHIFKKVISSQSGYLKDKTRVLVTNNITILPEVDQIIVLSNGRISETGTYQELMANSGRFADFVREFSDRPQQEEASPVSEELLESPRIRSESMRLRSCSVQSKDSQKNENAEQKLIEAEKAETGNVKFSVYLRYFRSLTMLWLFLTLAGFVLMQAFSLGSNVWLADWTDDLPPANSSALSDQEKSLRNTRLSVYGLLGVLQAVAVLFGAYAMARGSIHSSRILHKLLLERIMRSPMQFFDTTPLGRVVNRFAKDIDTVDSNIPHSIRAWLFCFLQVFATFLLIIFEIPIFLAVVVPVLVIYYFFQKFYVATSRQLKRLESVTRSPIYSHFTETLYGVSTIRAYGAVRRFIAESNRRVDNNQRCYFPSLIANRWLALRLEFCGNLFIFFAAVFTVHSRDSFNSEQGYAGLIMTYALSVTQTLNWLVRTTSEIETNIVSVERIDEYCNIESEKEWERTSEPDSEPKLAEDWPQQGEIKFDGYSVRYREGLDLVLRQLDITINKSEKIGIVGRTGAGKSSLTLALFRLLEAAEGSIIIDGVDISKIGLHELRRKLSIIPQDPILFSGTIRSNLDPFNMYSDDVLMQALEHSHLKSYVINLEAGLEHEVAENGENLSVGQRQLMCLARALLKRTKILVLDEASGSLDLESDSLLQKTIRREFKDCTILTIAHRLNTIIDSDRVLVLDKGQMVEFDAPGKLLQDKRGKFYSLAKDAGIV